MAHCDTSVHETTALRQQTAAGVNGSLHSVVRLKLRYGFAFVHGYYDSPSVQQSQR
jgi:hypothetical protein